MKPISEMNVSELTDELGRLRIERPAQPTGPRAVFVVDRGWIFAGDASETPDGYIRLDNAVHVFRWESIGFAAAIQEWRSGKVDIRKVLPVEIPKASIVFRLPVETDWGIK